MKRKERLQSARWERILERAPAKDCNLVKSKIEYSKRLILIIDNDPLNLSRSCHLFLSLGCEVCCAQSALKGAEILSQEIDLVVFSLNLEADYAQTIMMKKFKKSHLVVTGEFLSIESCCCFLDMLNSSNA